MDQKLAGRRVQVDGGSTGDQMEEGRHLAVKRGRLDRVHGCEGNIAPLEGDSLNKGGGESFVDAISELDGGREEWGAISLDGESPFSHRRALPRGRGFSRSRGGGWRRAGL